MDDMENEKRKLSGYTIENILERDNEMGASEEEETQKPSIMMPSFIIKNKLKLPPAPAQVGEPLKNCILFLFLCILF